MFSSKDTYQELVAIAEKDASLQYTTGILLYTGACGVEDHKTALYYIVSSAGKGYAPAKYTLDRLLEHREFVYDYDTVQQNIEKNYALFYSTSLASHIENYTQIQKYHNVRAGHGFAAEDANALDDILHGRHVEKTGLSNTLNGPDRIVDGIKIQVKYYQTAEKSVNAAFSDNQYRYSGQVLEVPSDQYEQALEKMKDHIRQGHVLDADGRRITNPEDASKIIKKGAVTYRQARNIARAGNIDSLVFDIKTQSIHCASSFGVTFAVDYALNRWNGKNNKEALLGATRQALQSGAATAFIGVASSQILRTECAASLTPIMRAGLKSLSESGLGKSAVEAIAKASTGKALHGAAAINHVAKLMKSNVVTATVTAVVMAAPDFYRAAIARNISWGQFGKNLSVLVAGVAGGTGGWMGGAAAGAALGSAVPVIGTAAGGIIGGIIGSIGGGYLSGQLAQKVADNIREDDAKVMLGIVQKEAERAAFDHMLMEDEIALLVQHIKDTVNPDWLKDMYASASGNSGRAAFAYNNFAVFCTGLLERRQPVTLSDDQIFRFMVPLLKKMARRQKIMNFLDKWWIFDIRPLYGLATAGFSRWKQHLGNMPLSRRKIMAGLEGLLTLFLLYLCFGAIKAMPLVFLLLLECLLFILHKKNR